jgi:hypothetical protein
MEFHLDLAEKKDRVYVPNSTFSALTTATFISLPINYIKIIKKIK